MTDDLDLNELLGNGDDDVTMPSIPDVPASQLTSPAEDVSEAKCAFCDCWMTGIRAGKRVCLFHSSNDGSENCSKCQTRKAMANPSYIAEGHKHEQLSHPTPQPIVTELPDLSPATTSPDLKDEAGQLDEEYYLTFNATIVEVASLEPEALQELRHRLDRMIRRAKIQQRAIRVTEEGKLQFVEEKRRKAIRTKDTEFMARRKKADEATEGQVAKAPRAAKSGATGIPQIEKQIKQFVKLNMSEATIRATLTGIGATVPSNLPELISKYSK